MMLLDLDRTAANAADLLAHIESLDIDMLADQLQPLNAVGQLDLGRLPYPNALDSYFLDVQARNQTLAPD